MDRDLMITRIPIKETEERMLCKPFQHLIDERQREVILLCSLVIFLVIYTHPPSHDGSLRDQLVLIISNDRHASLLRHNLHGTYPLAIGHGVDYTHVQEF